MRPNFLFIVCDDLNSWISPLGRHPDAQTPNIEALARRGNLFVNAYCCAPYCNASRMGVFTGCLPSTTGIYNNEPLWNAAQRRPTIVELLRSSGYYTFGAGKVFHGVFDYATATRERSASANWREIENRPFLWDEFHANQTEPLPPNRPLNGLVDFGKFEEVDPWYYLFDWGPLPDDRADDIPDARVLATVTEFLTKAPAEPFFCAAGFYKPHLPWHVPKQFFDLYDPEKIALPLVKSNDLEDVPEIARNWALSPPDHRLVTTHHQWPQAIHGYLAAMSYVDSLIGKLMDVLDRTGLAETTAIILLADHGFHLGEKLHWRKFALWEEATRVPLIVVPPKPFSRQQRIYSPVSLVDIFPTLAEMAGLSDPPKPDGSSLVPLISDPSAPRAAPAIMTWGRGNSSVRRGHWRYTVYADGSEELYDHAVDPHEWTNLAADPAFRHVCDSLKAHVPTCSSADA